MKARKLGASELLLSMLVRQVAQGFNVCFMSATLCGPPGVFPPKVPSNTSASSSAASSSILKGGIGIRDAGLTIQFSSAMPLPDLFRFLSVQVFHQSFFFLLIVLHLVIPFDYANADYFILTMGTLAHRMLCPKPCLAEK